MAKPNFFIIGAPKCGTTALYSYLESHPNIYLPSVKEPHYFSEDLPNMRAVDSLDEYLSLFKHSESSEKAVGEASVMYLYSEVALKKIRDFAPDAKIIVMLRNPVELVYSFHSQLRYGFHEQKACFEEAWALQSERKNGRSLPSRQTDPALLQYKSLGELGRQVDRLLKVFPEEQIKFILFDDFKASPKQVYEETLEFLGVPFDNRADFPKVNGNKEYSSPLLAQLLVFLIAIQRRIKRSLGIQPAGKKRFLRFLNVLKYLRQLNTKSAARGSLSQDFKNVVVEEFSSDIQRLSSLIKRDLSHWKRP